MIVNRRTFNVKQGCEQELVALVLEEIVATSEDGSYTGTTRVYRSSIGTFNQLAVEWEYEDLAEYERVGRVVGEADDGRIHARVP
jgi:putative lipoic acid-binding regulatory protein